MKLNKEKEQCEVQNCSYHKLQRTVGRKRPEQETIEADGVLVGDIKCKNDKIFYMKVRAAYKMENRKPVVNTTSSVSGSLKSLLCRLLKCNVIFHILKFQVDRISLI